MNDYSAAIDQQLDLLHAEDSSCHRPDCWTDESGDPDVMGHHATILSLRHGETFYWTPVLLNVATEAGRTMPAWTPYEDEFFVPVGFFYFSVPTSWGQSDREITGVSWLLSNWDRDEEDPTAWIIVHLRAPDGHLETLSLPAKCGRPVSESISGEHAEVAEAVMRWFGAMMIFIQQRIFINHEVMPTRASRRRAERMSVSPVLRIIELRRQETSARNQHQAPAWSCRWVVSGHWHRYWYATLKRHRTRWVLPYVKGPDDKPLKAARGRVYVVNR